MLFAKGEKKRKNDSIQSIDRKTMRKMSQWKVSGSESYLKKMQGKKKKRPRGNAFRKSAIFFLVLIFALAVIYVILFSNFLAFEKISVTGNTIIKERDILDETNMILAGKYFNVLSKNNYFLVSKNKTGAVLKERFRILEDVSVKKEFPNGIKISCKERTIRLVYCPNSNCYFIDENGAAFDDWSHRASYPFSEKMIILREEKERNIGMQDILLQNQFVDYVVMIREKLQGVEIRLENDFYTPSVVSGEIKVRTSQGWQILFNTEIGIDKETDMLKAVLDSKIEKGSRNELEYIDLRNDNKVYYKLKQSGEEKKENSSEKDIKE